MAKSKRRKDAAIARSKRFVQQPVAQIQGSESAAVPPDYADFVAEVRARIHAAQLRSAVAVNSELIELYWTIGRDIVHRQRERGWGAKVVDWLAADLRSAFPGVEGFSPRNLKYMRALALAYPDGQFVQQLVAQIPWGHNVRLLDSVKDPNEREWYIRQTIQHGWSRAMLVHWVESGLYARQGQAVNNFDSTLPPEQSDLARQLLKDPYNFDFLTLAADAAERDLERGLLDHIRKFLLELGAGFAFVGQQVPVEVDGDDFSIDLLFYHLRLRCFVVVDLKVEAFKPEFAGKMNFYLSAVDDLMRHSDDKPSIGLILCRTTKRTVAEYALRDLAKPVGVARYVTRLVETLPPELAGALPSKAQLMAELEKATSNPPSTITTGDVISTKRKRRGGNG